MVEHRHLTSYFIRNCNFREVIHWLVRFQKDIQTHHAHQLIRGHHQSLWVWIAAWGFYPRRHLLLPGCRTLSPNARGGGSEGWVGMRVVYLCSRYATVLDCYCCQHHRHRHYYQHHDHNHCSQYVHHHHHHQYHQHHCHHHHHYDHRHHYDHNPLQWLTVKENVVRVPDKTVRLWTEWD